ncbi:MAG: peptide chain release factor N(5)-glutamine methyltransferase [Lachnospiraceae bacterium]|nr:peptide chain release factor N(5)-glutamine methyltransferase [Lachnospiraceae bacterium]
MNATNSDNLTYREAARRWGESLQAAGVPEAALQAQQLLWYVCGMTPADWLMRREDTMPAEEWERYCELAEKRLARVPLQHLTGEQEFMGLPFRVTPDVLIPRQDTEHLVEEALACCEGRRVLDMCTGSGCIAISIARLGKPASVTGADISEAALAVAGDNAARLGADVAWVKSDMFAGIDGEFDVIVSNPPYIPPEQIEGLEPEVKDYEPRLALYGGEDGLDYYRTLVTDGAKHLRPARNGEEGGILIVEIGFDQGVSVPALFREAGFTGVRVRKDYAGLDRVVVGHL